MTNLEVGLITFIITLIFCSMGNTIVRDKDIREKEYLCLNGTIWKKIDDIGAEE